MFIVFLAAEQCVDTYVRSCTPTPTVPSDTFVRTVTDLATTGAEANIAGIVAALSMLGGGILFVYNHLRNKERKK